MPRLTRFLPDEAATQQLGRDLAVALKRGDVLLLSGDLGAGKTTLARALIRANAGDPALETPSPTFTLVQNYEGRVPVSHFDFYRLGSPDELIELGFDEAVSEGAAIAEWPEKVWSTTPSGSVSICFTHQGEGRGAEIVGQGDFFERITRSLEIREFLDRARVNGERIPFPADASARAYETIVSPDTPPLILMNSPPLRLGPPVKDGKPYAVIAHTAQTVAAFVAIDEALRERGFAAPEIHAVDAGKGLVLMEHLGSGSCLDAEGRPITERYQAAAILLAELHGKAWPPHLDAPGGIVHDVPPFDRDALMIEVELLLDWYVPWKTGQPAGPDLRKEFASVWNEVIDRLERAEKSIVLRDWHSPNIVWRAERQGLDRLGLLDFQDALIGPAAYDLASLAFDARVTVAEEIEQATFVAYAAARRARGEFDEAGFREAYAITAVQRNTKILGIFVRLDRRDGKPAYLRHLPRIRAYLRRALSHPALANMRAFYQKHGLLEEEQT